VVPKFFIAPSMFAVNSRTNSSESRSAPAMRTLAPLGGVEHLLGEIIQPRNQAGEPGLRTAHSSLLFQLTLQSRLHVSRFHWKPPHDFSGGVVKGRCDGRRSERIRRLRTSSVRADFRIVK
jgi:hypothetical protein